MTARDLTSLARVKVPQQTTSRVLARVISTPTSGINGPSRVPRIWTRTTKVAIDGAKTSASLSERVARDKEGRGEKNQRPNVMSVRSLKGTGSRRPPFLLHLIDVNKNRKTVTFSMRLWSLIGDCCLGFALLLIPKPGSPPAVEERSRAGCSSGASEGTPPIGFAWCNDQ